MKIGTLDNKGYIIKKSDITKTQVKDIITELTVTPLTFDFGKDTDKDNLKYKVYSEDDDTITIPRYFGVKKFGEPKKVKFDPQEAKIEFTGSLRDYQHEMVNTCIEHMNKYGGGLLVVPCGNGKCFAKGTKIFMYNGEIKNVEDIKIGDVLMGDDSTPRNVLNLGQGTEEMFDIFTDVNKYTVNKSHILSFVVDTTYLTEIELYAFNKNNKVVIDSNLCYKFGNNIYSRNKYVDMSVSDYLSMPVLIKRVLKGYRRAIDNFGKNDDKKDFYKIGGKIVKEKIMYIPKKYLLSSYENRRKLLAGIFDSTNYFLPDKNSRLKQDILFILNTLLTKYYIIDNRIIYERSYHDSRIQLYNVQVKSIGTGEYYGFEIDGNKRFMLEDCTITHNTTMAIYIAAKFGLKTLILTHKTFLQDQWIARCKQFTKSEVGTIRQKTVDVEGKDFVIGMIQSISKRDYGDIFSDYGIVIVDECHHFSSKHFSKALAKCGAKYTIGLSATPNRSDGLIRVVNWYLGDIMFRKKMQTNNQVVSKIVYFTSNDKLFAEKRRYFSGQLKPDCVKMISNLIKIESRNQQLVNIIDQLRKDPDRKILILSARIDHLKLLKGRVDSLIKDDVDADLIMKDECKTYYYIGATKQQDRFEAEKQADILFASYDMAHEGLDIDRLNTVVLATPKKDVIQAIGRILRKVLENGDVRPLIVDITDKLSIFESQGNKREEFYKKSQYGRNYYYICDDDIISPYTYSKNIGEEDNSLSKKVPKNYSEMLQVEPVEITCGKEEKNEDNKEDNETEYKIQKKTYKKNINVSTKSLMGMFGVS